MFWVVFAIIVAWGLLAAVICVAVSMQSSRRHQQEGWVEEHYETTREPESDLPPAPTAPLLKTKTGR